MRRWVPERPRPRRKDLREDAKFRLQVASRPVPDIAVRLAGAAGVTVSEVAELTGKTEKEVREIMEGTPTGTAQSGTTTGEQVQDVASVQQQEAPVQEDYRDRDEDSPKSDSYSQEELLAALFSEDEIAAKASAARARGDVEAATVLDQFHADTVEQREQRERDAEG